MTESPTPTGASEGWIRRAWRLLTESRDQGALVTFALSIVVGLLGLIGYAASSSKWLMIIANEGLIAGSALAFGGLLGFLFAIPRSPSMMQPTEGRSEPRPLWANSNLEQISDWLVKILVGVGLTQLTQVPSKIRELVDYLAPSLGDGSSRGLVLAVLVYFSVSGFLGCYLWTRIFLPRALAKAET
jgi:hypothetical protein